MRWLTLVLFACSCGSPAPSTVPVAPGASSGPSASTSRPELARGLPAADPLERGKDVERTIKGGETQPLEIYLDAGRFEMGLRESNRHMRDVLVAKGYA